MSADDLVPSDQDARLRRLALLYVWKMEDLPPGVAVTREGGFVAMR